MPQHQVSDLMGRDPPLAILGGLDHVRTQPDDARTASPPIFGVPTRPLPAQNNDRAPRRRSQHDCSPSSNAAGSPRIVDRRTCYWDAILTASRIAHLAQRPSDAGGTAGSSSSAADRGSSVAFAGSANDSADDSLGALFFSSAITSSIC